MLHVGWVPLRPYNAAEDMPCTGIMQQPAQTPPNERVSSGSLECLDLEQAEFDQLWRVINPAAVIGFRKSYKAAPRMENAKHFVQDPGWYFDP